MPWYMWLAIIMIILQFVGEFKIVGNKVTDEECTEVCEEAVPEAVGTDE